MKRLILAVAVLATMLVAGCGIDRTTTPTATTGQGQLALTLPPPAGDGVAGFLIEACGPLGPTAVCSWPCASGLLASAWAPVEQSKNFPADSFFDVFLGYYCVQATPMTGPPGAGKPVKECTVAQGGPYWVEPGRTTEAMLVSNCDRPDTGGLDVAVSLNNDPLIESLVYKPSKYVCEGEELAVIVTAVDPDGDALTWSWAGLPAGCTALDGVLTCYPVTSSAGTYWVTVKACDPGGLCAKLEFPIHVLKCQ